MVIDPDPFSWSILVDFEAALGGLAAKLAPMLKPGILITLEGDLGAGKTAFARALLRGLTGDQNLEVPSPTFTIIQEYQTPRGPLSHFDLYRLSGRDELDELGLEDALADTITLIEWPDMAGHLADDRIDIQIAMGTSSEARTFNITGHGQCTSALVRMKAVHEFLVGAGWGDAARTLLHGDASTRSYELLSLEGEQAIFMNAPPQPDGPIIRDGRTYSDIAHLAEDINAFCAIARGLAENGFPGPDIYAHDNVNGFILLEYFGSETIIDATSGNPIEERYQVATDLLNAMHRTFWPSSVSDDDGAIYKVPIYDNEAFLIEVELLLDWFLPAATGIAATTAQRSSFLKIWDNLFCHISTEAPVWVMRDFHSPNLHWRAERQGLDRIGLIDFQDAVLGHPAYDLVSLLQDARVTVDEDMEARLLTRYLASAQPQSDFQIDEFKRAYAILGAQRNTKILGIFIRLARRDGKPAYLKHLPRISNYLTRDLAHPALADLSSWYRTHLPQALAVDLEMFAGDLTS